jgi:hypothetical protein
MALGLQLQAAPPPAPAPEALRIPAATLRVLIGEGSLPASSFRRTLIERIWTCGCSAKYTLTNSDYVDWMPCARHRPVN